MLSSADVGHGQLVEDTCLDQGIAEKHRLLSTINFADEADRKFSQPARQLSCLQHFDLRARRQTTVFSTRFVCRCLPLINKHDLTYFDSRKQATTLWSAEWRIIIRARTRSRMRSMRTEQSTRDVHETFSAETETRLRPRRYKLPRRCRDVWCKAALKIPFSSLQMALKFL